MCGLIGSFNFGKEKDSVNKFVIDTLQDQISRGKEGFGIIFIGKNNKVTVERSCEMTKAMLDLYRTESKMIILHHRFPTSSDNKLSQTHPLVVDNGSLKYKYLFVHNGIIANAKEVKEAHEKLGFEYCTSYTQEWSNAATEIKFNDSETLAIELARFIEKQTDTLAVLGAAAFIGVQIDRKNDKAIKIFFGRNTSPLNLSATRGKIRLSSEGEGSSVAEDYLYEFSLKDFKIIRHKMKIEKAKEYVSSYDWESYYGGYNPNTSVLGRLGEDKSEDKPADSLEEKLCEISEDNATIVDSLTADYFMKLSDPSTVMLMDEDSEIREAIQQIVATFRDTFIKCQQAVMDSEADRLQGQAVKGFVEEEPVVMRQIAVREEVMA